MNGKNGKKSVRTARSAGGGALALAIIGLILFSPLNAGAGADGTGRHHPGSMDAGQRRLAADPQTHIAFLEIVLDLSADQVEEIRPVLAEHREKVDEIHEKYGMRPRRDIRMNHMQGRGCCDKVDRTEMRGEIRRQRREMEKDREKMHQRLERSRRDMDDRLAGILDEGQLRKYRALRELQDDRREHRADRREHRADRREHREERRQRHGGGA